MRRRRRRTGRRRRSGWDGGKEVGEAYLIAEGGHVKIHVKIYLCSTLIVFVPIHI
jgi:hypothetical protein